jgi:type IV secretory pathway component VirB8
MLKRLRNKWKVSGFQFFLIISTFAIGGSATGWASKKIMNLLNVSEDWYWSILYILLVTILWPVMVVLISIPLGQFKFFKNYIHKLGQKLGIIRSENN